MGVSVKGEFVWKGALCEKGALCQMGKELGTETPDTDI